MKTRILVVVGMVAILGSSVTFGVPAQGGVLGASKKIQRPKRNKPYEMLKAMSLLRDAKKSLEKAGERYDGHRAKAVDHLDQAIKEVQAGLDYANR